MKNKILIAGIFVVLSVVVISILGITEKKIMTVQQLDQEIDLIIANNPLKQMKGLSGTQIDTLGADGMIFIFPEKKERVFWMKDMNYNLDVLWVSGNKIVKIDRNISAPKQGEEPEYMYSRPFEVDKVIELPAGQVEKYSIFSGQILNIE